jgi:chromosome segregation ATPase
MILFKDLRTNINERRTRIEILLTEQNTLTEADSKGKIKISPGKRERAIQIAKAIAELRRLNEVDSALLARAQDISTRYNIPFDELHQLNLTTQGLERQIEELTEIIKEYTRIGLDKQKSSINSPFFQKEQLLKQAQVSLFNHVQAREELQAVLDGIK